MLAKIYKIEPIVAHDEGDVYYGYTTRKYLCDRYSKHKYQFLKNEKKQTSAKILFDKYGVDNCYYFLVEEINKEDVKEREKYYILNNKCVNKCVHNRYENNNYNKSYYEANREKILENLKERREAKKLNPPQSL